MNEGVSPEARKAVLAELRTRQPWIVDAEFGPTSVDAGHCDRCGLHPRVVATCGPGEYNAVCPSCADVLGEDGWCVGHRDQAVAARAWIEQLPVRWADMVIAWWAATGELRLPRP